MGFTVVAFVLGYVLVIHNFTATILDSNANILQQFQKLAVIEVHGDCFGLFFNCDTSLL